MAFASARNLLRVWRDRRRAAYATARLHWASWRSAALKLSRELYGDNLPPAFDDVKSVGAQAAIFKLRYSSCTIHDGHCIVRTAEEDCGNRACS